MTPAAPERGPASKSESQKAETPAWGRLPARKDSWKAESMDWRTVVGIGPQPIERAESPQAESSQAAGARRWKQYFSSEVVPHHDVHGSHRTGAGYPAKRRRPERRGKAREAWRIGKVLDLPADVQMMAFLRPEPEGFRQRRVPVECAWTFDRAAMLVAETRGRRRGESRGVEKRER